MTLKVEGLDITVAGRTLCKGLEIEFLPGQCWGILGGNGCGKTTLLHTLSAIQPHTCGKIDLNGTPINALPRNTIAQQLGLLLQESHDAFPCTVLESTLSGRHPHLGRWQSESEEDLRIAREAIQEMDLQPLEQRMVQTLSGGERRRLAIATLLTQAPSILLLDEPLNHLDLAHQMHLLQHLKGLAEGGSTVVMVLHDPNQAQRYCDNVLLLYGDGQWEKGSGDEMLTAERLSRLYQHPLRLLEQQGERLFIPETRMRN